MKFIRYKTKNDFLNANLDILLKEEVKNEVMIGIILQHHENKVNNWFLGRIENENVIEIIFAIDDDRNGLIMYLPQNVLDQNSLEFLFQNIINFNIKLDEIVVPYQFYEQITTTYNKIFKKEITYSEISYIYELNNIKEKNILGENEKLVKLEEEPKNLPHLISIVKEIHTDIYKEAPCSDEEALQIAKIYLNKGLYLLTNNDESKIYAQVVNVRKQIHGSTIGAVITPKEFRGQGYGKKCITAVCDKLLENSDFIALHVSVSNEYAMNLYKKIGFKENCKVVTMLL